MGVLRSSPFDAQRRKRKPWLGLTHYLGTVPLDECASVFGYAASGTGDGCGRCGIIGDNPFSLVGGTGAIWIRAKEQAGKVRLTALLVRSH